MVIHSAEGIAQWAGACHDSGEQIALVPTMGNLHAGHLALVEEGQKHAPHVVVSIFVNPTQFGPGEDFERYPRTLDADLDALAAHGVEVAFVPGVDEVYPPGEKLPTIPAGPVGELFEGAARPGHFDGVLGVCHRLFFLTSCDIAVFGEKDAQQLFLVQDMVEKRQLPLRIVSVPIVRDADGLALSSRNAYLTPEQREVALALPKALTIAQRTIGTEGIEAALARAREHLVKTNGLDLDYVDVVAADTFQPLPPDQKGEAIILGAVKVGSTRLIDNVRTPF